MSTRSTSPCTGNEEDAEEDDDDDNDEGSDIKYYIILIKLIRTVRIFPWFRYQITSRSVER